MDGDKVIDFQEKPQMQEGWINGGFFVIESGFFDLIKDDKTILERDPFRVSIEKGRAIRIQAPWILALHGY